MRPSAPELELQEPQVSPFRQMLSIAGLILLGAACACAPPTPAQKASEAARNTNQAARWGRMDEAMNNTSAESRPEFAKHRAEWHDELRIVDTELAGLDMKDATHAVVEVDVSWMFADDPTVRITRLTQDWSDESGKWRLVKEERLSGDVGLFGEEVKRLDKPKDKHFPSRTIH